MANSTPADAPNRRQPSASEPEATTPDPSSRQRRLGLPLRSRPWLYSLLGLGAMGLVVLLLRPAPTQVDIVAVKRGDLQVTVEAEGQTRVRDRFAIAAPVDGRLNRITLEAGDRVAAGEVVARLDPLPLTSEVRQAQAQIRRLEAEMAGVDTLRPKSTALDQAQARIRAAQAAQRQAMAELDQADARRQQAQRELQRANQLLARGAIAQQDQEAAALAATARQKDWEAAQQAVATAAAEVEAAQNAYTLLQAEQQDPDYLIQVYQAEIDQVQAELARLADDSSRTAITSPAAGQVLRVLEPSSRFVTAGTPLIDVGNPAKLELIIDVLSTDAVAIQPGDPIEITQWGGPTTLAGRVRTIEPSAFTKTSALGVEEQRVNIIGDFGAATVPLGDGYRVDTQIVVDAVANALTIPVSAVFPCEAQDCVFVVENQRARRRSVALGLRNSVAAVVETGLTAGDRVISYPDSVEEGDRVVAR